MMCRNSWCVMKAITPLRFAACREVKNGMFSTSSVVWERLRRQAVPLRCAKPTKVWNEKQGRTDFADWARVKVSGGCGGDGCISTLSEMGVEFAGPDGGDGGNGGHVVFKAVKTVKDLSHLQSVICGPSGGKGRNRNCHGRDAKHKIIEVPVGTMFKNMDGNTVCELMEDGSMFLAAKGGAGGRGNRFFRSSTKKTPKLAESGGFGEQFYFDIEMKTMAHVGLVGFPNAGKSTLLRAVSRARPKVAAYPFTTLKPHVGMIKFDDHEQMAIADIPGLIEGAHINKGLGISFLRHIERCLCLVYVIDLAQQNPIEQFEVLKYELEQYNAGLSQRPHAIVANKIDQEPARENVEPFQEYVREKVGVPLFFVSGKLGMNLRPMLDFMRHTYDASRREENQN